MKIYQVGGSVRDKLLGVPPQDIDYVVVGSSPEEMIALGYEQVGKAFPVFLKDGCEYALARREVKTGEGYNGFSTDTVDVTLEEDLMRRDLTINSMALDVTTSELIDPYGGQHDLAQGIIRATSPAFAEDPLRVLRAARFAARYDFTVDDDTNTMMHDIAPEIDSISADRIWIEVAKGLMEPHPHRFIRVLESCSAMTRSQLLRMYRFGHGAAKQFQHLASEGRLPELNKAEWRFALAVDTPATSNLQRLRVPTDVIDFFRKWYQCQYSLALYATGSPESRLQFIRDLGCLHDTQVVHDLNTVADIVGTKRLDMGKLLSDIRVLKALDLATITASATDKRAAVAEAQIKALT